MLSESSRCAHTLSVVIPCFNEVSTLRECVARVLDIEDDSLTLEVVIVDDHSTDGSQLVASDLASEHPQVSVLHHENNQGKGAALRTGFKHATGDFIGVQDADLEYKPTDLKKLLEPLIEGEADVVLGSRFLSGGAHRVLYFWHSLGNRFLTVLSNMFTDLNLSDMETCYKVFRREILQKITIEENRFGFEPEIVAKVAQLKVRIYEIGISYYGRTYEEGKKIGVRDGIRALYCIIRYNSFNAPIPMQFLVYLFIGAFSAAVNLIIFLGVYSATADLTVSSLLSFFIAASVNYYLCIKILFRHKARWSTSSEPILYLILVAFMAMVDYWITHYFINMGLTASLARVSAIALQLVLNFAGRRYLIFPEKKRRPWKPQLDKKYKH